MIGPDEAWSLVVEWLRPYGNAGDAIWARMQFLAEEAPAKLLCAGAGFKLCEGKKVVAKGVVLPVTAQPPMELDSFAMALLG